MARFDDIYEIAADNYGLVTFAEALEAGVTSVELRRFVIDGRLERLGQGVYKLTKYISTVYDQYAEAVALVGPSSYIQGESVLAMHNLALVNPLRTSVATPKRTRRNGLATPNWTKSSSPSP
jgi:predicted transcriptional regulator of viral defense system